MSGYDCHLNYQIDFSKIAQTVTNDGLIQSKAKKKVKNFILSFYVSNMYQINFN